MRPRLPRPVGREHSTGGAIIAPVRRAHDAGPRRGRDRPGRAGLHRDPQHHQELVTPVPPTTCTIAFAKPPPVRLCVALPSDCIAQPLELSPTAATPLSEWPATP